MIYVDLMIFDIDGTLIDSRKDIVTAVNFTLKKLGLSERSFAEVVSYIGTGVRDLLRKSVGDKNKGLLEKGLSVFGDYYSKHSSDESVLRTK